MESFPLESFWSSPLLKYLELRSKIGSSALLSRRLVEGGSGLKVRLSFVAVLTRQEGKERIVTTLREKSSPLSVLGIFLRNDAPFIGENFYQKALR